jgi:hypothetical protein
MPSNFATPQSCLPSIFVGCESFYILTSNVVVKTRTFVIASTLKTLGDALGLTSLGFALGSLLIQVSITSMNVCIM